MEATNESPFLLLSSVARADDLACVSTTFSLLSPNDKVC